MSLDIMFVFVQNVSVYGYKYMLVFILKQFIFCLEKYFILLQIRVGFLVFEVPEMKTV